MLARREHSRRELAAKLSRRGFETSDLTPVLDSLEAEGLLSDERFAEAYVESRARRGFGPVRIIEELRQRGISGAACRDACDPGAPSWKALATVARRKRFGAALPADFDARARQARFLAGRGFDHAQVKAALADDDSGGESGGDFELF